MKDKRNKTKLIPPTVVVIQVAEYDVCTKGWKKGKLMLVLDN